MKETCRDYNDETPQVVHLEGTFEEVQKRKRSHQLCGDAYVKTYDRKGFYEMLEKEHGKGYADFIRLGEGARRSEPMYWAFQPGPSGPPTSLYHLSLSLLLPTYYVGVIKDG